jgi:hypothetical protein
MRSIRMPQRRWLGAASLIAVLAIVGLLVPRSPLASAQQAHAHITMAPGAPHATMVYDPGLVTGVILDAVQAAT